MCKAEAGLKKVARGGYQRQLCIDLNASHCETLTIEGSALGTARSIFFLLISQVKGTQFMMRPFLYTLH